MQLKLSANDVAKFIEGLLYGILTEEFKDLEKCFVESESFENDIVTAVKDFEKKTFDGVKDGLEEVGKAVELIPSLLKDCAQVKADLSALIKMAEIFRHPLSLIFNIGKNLIVNGKDILSKIEAAIASYKNSDFFNFGKNIGQALAEVLLKSEETKNKYDENAFYFLHGFLN